MLQRLQVPPALDGSLWRYANLAAANRRHRHAELELNLVIRGTGTYLLGSRQYSIRRGDLLWLFPAQEHVLVEQTPEFEMWIAVVKRRALRRIAIDPGTRALLQSSYPGEAGRRLRAHDLSRCEELFGELAAAGDEPGLLNAGLGYVLLHAWKCFQRAGDVPMRTLHPAVERAASLIRNDDAEQSLAGLGRRVGLSTSRLSRLFKEQTGTSMVEFRNRQRIERFLDLYRDGSEKQGLRRTLLDMALEAGFGSYPQFHRVFCQVVGCSPAMYARRHA